MLAVPEESDEMDLDEPKKKKKSGPIESHAVMALRCAFQVLEKRIISNPNDMMGILLFGTEKTKFYDGSNSFPNCYLLMDLDVPAASNIKDLRNLLECECGLCTVYFITISAIY